MIESNIFVGRREEIQRFVEILREKKGQAILVVGQAAMGKTCLINKMTEVAERHSELKCVAVRYEVIPTDSVDSILAIMLDHAFDASRAASKYFSGKISPLEHRREQWFWLFKTLFPDMATLAPALRRDPTGSTRAQFCEKLTLIVLI